MIVLTGRFGDALLLLEKQTKVLSGFICIPPRTKIARIAMHLPKSVLVVRQKNTTLAGLEPEQLEDHVGKVIEQLPRRQDK